MWHAKCLHRTLATTHLASLVHDLRELHQWIRNLNFFQWSQESVAFHIPGFSKTLSWAFSIIELCPNVKILDIPLGSTALLSRLLQAIQTASSSLMKIGFWSNSSISLECSSTPEFVETVLSSPASRNVTSIGIYYGTQVDSTVSDLSPAIGAALESFTIFASQNSLKEIKSCFSVDPSNLRDVTISFRFAPSGDSDFEWIFNYLPVVTLDKLSIVSASSRGLVRYPPDIKDYVKAKDLPRIPFASFPSFPSLRSLTLSEFEGPSIELLQQLIKTAPSIVYLDFNRSVWTREDILAPVFPSDPPEIFAKIVFPEEQVLDLLLKFASLRLVNLGYLPTTDPNRYRGIQESLAEKGIETRWTELF